MVGTTYRYLDRAAITAPATQRILIDTRQLVDVALQWEQLAAAGAAAILVFGTLEQDEGRLAALNPADGQWFLLPDQFATNPTAAIGTDLLAIENVPAAFLLVNLSVTTSLTNFSFLARGRKRG